MDQIPHDAAFPNMRAKHLQHAFATCFRSFESLICQNPKFGSLTNSLTSPNIPHSGFSVAVNIFMYFCTFVYMKTKNALCHVRQCVRVSVLFDHKVVLNLNWRDGPLWHKTAQFYYFPRAWLKPQFLSLHAHEFDPTFAFLFYQFLTFYRWKCSFLFVPAGSSANAKHRNLFLQKFYRL